MGEPLKHDSEALLAEVDWVRALARRLTADAHAADDLAQDALAAALARPPAELRSLRGWLAGVLRNLAREERRSASHRVARERNAAREEVAAAGSSDEALERLESHRALVDAVTALAEPYRSAIVLRYFEGLSPLAIARRTGAPVRTVHTRLGRALEQLRSALDRAYRGDRNAWLLALIPYAGGSARSSLAAGALVMDAKLKLAVAAVAVVALCSTIVYWRGAPASAGAVARDAAPALARPEAPQAETAAEPALREAAPAEQRREVASAPPAAAALAVAERADEQRLLGRVVDVEQRAVPGIRVRFVPHSSDAALEPREVGVVEAISDAGGAFALPRPALGGVLEVAQPGWTSLFRPEFDDAPAEGEVVLVAALSVTLGGRVVDEQGRGVEGALVRCHCRSSCARASTPFSTARRPSSARRRAMRTGGSSSRACRSCPASSS